MAMNNMSPLRPSAGGGGGGGYADFEAGFLSQPFRPSDSGRGMYDPMGIGSENLAGFMRQPFRPSSERFSQFVPKIPHSGSKLDRFRGPFGSKRMEDLLGKGLMNFLENFTDWWLTRGPYSPVGQYRLPPGWTMFCPGWTTLARTWGHINSCGTGPTSGQITIPPNTENRAAYLNNRWWVYITEPNPTVLGPNFYRRNATAWTPGTVGNEPTVIPGWFRPTDANDHSWPESWPDEVPAGEAEPSGTTISWPGYRTPATVVEITPQGVSEPRDGDHRYVPSTENKVKLLQWASSIFGTATEVGDFFEALAGAMPDNRCKNKGIYDTAMCVLENWEHIDPLEAGKNLVANELEDRLYGAGFKAIQTAGGKLGAGGLTGFELGKMLDTALGASFDSGVGRLTPAPKRARLPTRKMVNV